MSTHQAKGNSQCRKHLLLRLLIVYRLLLRFWPPRDQPQTHQVQRVVPRPAFGQVIEHVDVPEPHLLARVPDAPHNRLDSRLVDKVVQPLLVRVGELEFVVVGQKACEDKGLQRLSGRLGFLDELEGSASLHRVVLGGRLSTFMMAGKRSRWIKYVRRLVWYAPAVTARTTSTAFLRRLTARMSAHCHTFCRPLLPRTVFAVADNLLQSPRKLGENGIDVVDARQDGDNVGARMGVSLAEGFGQEDA